MKTTGLLGFTSGTSSEYTSPTQNSTTRVNLDHLKQQVFTMERMQLQNSIAFLETHQPAETLTDFVLFVRHHQIQDLILIEAKINEIFHGLKSSSAFLKALFEKDIYQFASIIACINDDHKIEAALAHILEQNSEQSLKRLTELFNKMADDIAEAETYTERDDDSLDVDIEESDEDDSSSISAHSDTIKTDLELEPTNPPEDDAIQKWRPTKEQFLHLLQLIPNRARLFSKLSDGTIETAIEAAYAANQSQTIFQWLEELIIFENTIDKRHDWVELFTDYIRDFDKFLEYLAIPASSEPMDILDDEELEEINPPSMTAKRSASLIAPYLFLGVCDSGWDQLMLNGDYNIYGYAYSDLTNQEKEALCLEKAELASKIYFNVSMDDPCLRNIFFKIYNKKNTWSAISCDLKIAVKSTPDMPTDVRSMSQIKTNLIDAMRFEMIEGYQTVIEMLPPLLIGITAISDDYRKIYLKIARYFSRDQLIALSLALNRKEVFEEVKEMLPHLHQDQFKIILNSLSPIQLKSYLEEKQKNDENQEPAILELLTQVPIDIMFIKQQTNSQTIIEEKDQNFLKEQIEELNSKLIRLKSLVCTGMGVYELDLEDFLVNAPSENIPESSISYFTERLDRFRGYQKECSTLFNQYDELPNLAQDEDEEIYEGFWVLLRQEYLVHLNIAHGGELSSLGIRSEKDLEYLNISKGRQIHLDHLASSLRSFLSFQHENIIKFEELFAKAMHVKVNKGSNNFNEDLYKIIELFATEIRYSNSRPPHTEMKNFLYRLTEEMLVIESQEEDFILKIKEYKELLSVNKNISELSTISDEILKMSLELIKNNHTLTRLSYYLLQSQKEEFKQLWDALHTQGIFTLSELIKADIINESELYNLKEALIYLNL